MSKKFTVAVTQEIEVTVDESRFTPEFMQRFREVFYEFETIENHVEYIAQCYARGIVSFNSDFLKGYGPMNEFGISVRKASPVECEVKS